MNKVKFFQIGFFLLLITNLLLISLFFFHHKHSKKSPKDFIINQLKFDKEQEKQYEVQIDFHKAAISTSTKKIRTLKQSLYQGLTMDIALAKTDSIINIINSKQKEIEHIHLNHFKEIKAICTPEQLPLFEELVGELGHLFRPHPREKH